MFALFVVLSSLSTISSFVNIKLVPLRSSVASFLETPSNLDSRPLISINPAKVNSKFHIQEIVPTERVEAVRLRFISVASEQMAQECHDLISTGNSNFESIASMLSLCEMTKSKGGDAGWQQRNTNGDGSEHEWRPSPQLLNTAFYMAKGEMRIVSTSTSNNDFKDIATPHWHVIQVTDILTSLSPALKKRRKENFLQMARGGNSALSMTYTIETMGCQMNSADSERIEGQLHELGYTKAPPSSDAKPGLVVFNTCSIRDHAEHKVYSHIGPHAQRKRNGENVAIVVAGCVAQQEGEALLRRFPEVDLVMGPQYANRVGDLLEAVLGGHQVVATDPAVQSEDTVTALRKSDVSAFVNVIYGCNERCSYCVVPNTRGVEQSRTLDAIVAEVGDLVTNGYKEVTLLGQNIDSWGRDLPQKARFADLLAAVGAVPGLGRVRFLTSHPKYMSDKLVGVLASSEVFAPCINIPFQSGDDDILRLMGRGYTRQRYLDIVKHIRAAMPDAAITADCIVGFPGETEEQFQRTLDLMEEVMSTHTPHPRTHEFEESVLIAFSR